MTEQEYLTKREQFAQSSADIETKSKAIKELDEMWLKQNESIVEMSDIKELS